MSEQDSFQNTSGGVALASSVHHHYHQDKPLPNLDISATTQVPTPPQNPSSPHLLHSSTATLYPSASASASDSSSNSSPPVMATPSTTPPSSSCNLSYDSQQPSEKSSHSSSKESRSRSPSRRHGRHRTQSQNGVHKEIQHLQHQLRQSQAIAQASRKRIENLTRMAVRIHRGLIRQMEVQHGTYPTRIPSVSSVSSTSSPSTSTFTTPSSSSLTSLPSSSSSSSSSTSQHASSNKSAPLHKGSVSSLKFAQMLYSQVPVRMKAKEAVSEFPALELWQDPEYLKKALSTTNLTVAQTPTGLADAPGLRNTAFLQPHVVSMNAEKFLKHLKSPEHLPSVKPPSSKRSSTTKQSKDSTASDDDDDVVLYMQSQNNNYPREFPSLQDDAPHSIPWADEALDADGPAAVNLWLGDCRTTSRLHNDNYENLYIQVAGSKEIYLIPPGDAYALDERFLKPLSYGSDMTLHDSFAEALQSLQDGDGATFTASSNNNSSSREQSGSSCASNNGLKSNSSSSDKSQSSNEAKNTSKAPVEENDVEMNLRRNDDVPTQTTLSEISTPNILFPTVDPSNPATFNDIYSNYAFVYRVVLNPGDMLYIPALWYHQVRVIDGAPNVSLNYWYDPPATNGQWMRWDYVRYCSAVLHGYHDPFYFDEQEEKQELEAMLKMENEEQMKQMQLLQQQLQQQYQRQASKKREKKEKSASSSGTFAANEKPETNIPESKATNSTTLPATKKD